LPKETTAAESPNWALNLEPCDYQADALAVCTCIHSACILICCSDDACKRVFFDTRKHNTHLRTLFVASLYCIIHECNCTIGVARRRNSRDQNLYILYWFSIPLKIFMVPQYYDLDGVCLIFRNKEFILTSGYRVIKS